MMYPRPVSRKRLRILLAASVLAAATQLLLHQWGYGAEVGESTEKFVPASGGATVELRREAIVTGDTVRLRGILRWSDADKQTLEPVADLAIAKLSSGEPFASISLEQVKGTLRDAGINIAMLNFTGSGSCTVSRSDVEYKEGDRLRQWANVKDRSDAVPTSQPATAPSAAAPTLATVSAPAAEERSAHTLRDVLVLDLSERLSLAADALQVRFNATDEKFLRMAEPLFQFDIESRRTRLGDVAWDVVIVSGKNKQKATIGGYARAWQNQLVLKRPVVAHTMVTDDDLVDRRILVDRLSDDPPAERAGVVGQQASRNIAAGITITSRMVEAMPMVRQGQLITVVVCAGGVQIKTVAEARDTASMGQTIRVRKPGTNEDFDVVVTGPQLGRATVINDAGAARVAAATP